MEVRGWSSVWFLRSYLPYFLETRSLTRTQGSPVRLGWLANEPPRDSHLYLSHTGNVSTSPYITIYVGPEDWI